MIKELISEIIKCLEGENKNKGDRREELISIPFNIVALEQHLGDEKYKELHDDLAKYEHYIRFEAEEGEEASYLCNGYIKIYFYTDDCECEEWGDCSDEYTDFTYRISLDMDSRYWGYCRCNEGNKDYDYRHSCCGHGCDWTAPAFTVTKEISLGSDEFDGDAHDFWDYEDKYNNVTLEDKKEHERLNKIKRLKDQQAYIVKQLEELEK